jgi:fatty-acyl-CoA synthase
MSEVYRSELTPVAFLRRAAYLHPARVAVAHEAGRRLTYGALGERSNRLAND